MDFNGSPENPTTKRVVLSTGPEMGYTHWGQQVRTLYCTVLYTINTAVCSMLPCVYALTATQ